jgi:hypothetical protein
MRYVLAAATPDQYDQRPLIGSQISFWLTTLSSRIKVQTKRGSVSTFLVAFFSLNRSQLVYSGLGTW